MLGKQPSVHNLHERWQMVFRMRPPRSGARLAGRLVKEGFKINDNRK